MKKSIPIGIIALALILMAEQANSQWYVRFGTGYNFKTSSYSELFNYKSYEGGSESEVIFWSLGKGVNFDGAITYMFNEYVGADLTFSYLLGGKTNSESTYSNSYYGSAIYKSEISSNMLRIIPAVILTPGLEKINPYARLGLLIGMGKIKNLEDDTDDDGKVLITYEYGGGVALGIQGAAGVQIPLKKCYFYAELYMVNMTYAPTKGEITKYEVDGEDLLHTLSKREREVKFAKELSSSDSSTPPPETEPDEALKIKLPYGSIGVNVGIVIKLGKD